MMSREASTDAAFADVVELIPQLPDLARRFDQATASLGTRIGDLAGVQTDDLERPVHARVRARREREDADDHVPLFRYLQEVAQLIDRACFSYSLYWRKEASMLQTLDRATHATSREESGSGPGA
jgi:hypothetical protein